VIVVSAGKPSSARANAGGEVRYGPINAGNAYLRRLLDGQHASPEARRAWPAGGTGEGRTGGAVHDCRAGEQMRSSCHGAEQH
jgi:hypothetical protein